MRNHYMRAVYINVFYMTHGIIHAIDAFAPRCVVKVPQCPSLVPQYPTERSSMIARECPGWASWATHFALNINRVYFTVPTRPPYARIYDNKNYTGPYWGTGAPVRNDSRFSAPVHGPVGGVVAHQKARQLASLFRVRRNAKGLATRCRCEAFLVLLSFIGRRRLRLLGTRGTLRSRHCLCRRTVGMSRRGRRPCQSVSLGSFPTRLTAS